ncbi:hypothetical protein [Methanobrevibacter sp.]
MSKTITNANIYTLAKTVKTSVEKNKKLESSFKVGDTSYTSSETAYALAYALNNLSSACTIPSVKAYSSDVGDTINEQVLPSDFKDQAKRVVSYISKNGQCPNYVTTVKSKKRASAKLFVYAFARTLVWYIDHNKTLPNYTTYNTSAFTSSSSSSSTTKSKYGHATKQGCDNMGQNNGYYCGCHSLQEIFRNLTGKVVAQSTIAGWAGTTSAGTDHNGLNTAVSKFNKTYGYNLSVEWKNFSDLGWSGIKKIVNSTNQDCVIHNLYRGTWGHYEVVNSVSDSNIKVQNSLGDKCSSGCYCGYVENRTPSTFKSYINGISQKSIMVITRK